MTNKGDGKSGVHREKMTTLAWKMMEMEKLGVRQVVETPTVLMGDYVPLKVQENVNYAEKNGGLGDEQNPFSLELGLEKGLVVLQELFDLGKKIK